ncbi:MAG: right-handed parallel beta-helix repeat-containing protein [Chryseobacterium sp.]|uniref:right-handed parallel beta-helix repeat-containing protein n=1 Tax=Chryseobacterium sp. TaxID=1871047 RepID=UPI0025C3ADD5|nr:right-handed parallel beta-helix repeat-containing protein [Chryseobacterium sp.]MCJ7932994.1 right-handed parallel beta-helix repeat-containing protein [Chryseobacterium sp.]
MMYKDIFQLFFLRISLGFVLLSCDGFAQGFSTKVVSQQIVSKYYSPNYKSQYYTTDPIFIVGPELLKGDDHTAVIQKIIDTHPNILLPNTTILINKNGLKIGSDKKIVFQKNTKIKFLGPANGSYSDVVKIYDAHNVEVINPIIVGSRNSNLEQSGQWSAGISVLNSKNIKIINPRITETYGDGIFIGSENGGFSENVTIYGGWIDIARRNGISITSGKNIKVQNILISNTFGHDPESGIDIEPSWDKDILENIVVNNVCTFNNGSAGISINLNGLSTNDIKKAKATNILIDGHTDIGSRHGFLTSLNVTQDMFDATGNIIIKNADWKLSRDVAYWKTPQDHRVNITFSRIKIDNVQKQRDFESSIKKTQNIKLTQ